MTLQHMLYLNDGAAAPLEAFRLGSVSSAGRRPFCNTWIALVLHCGESCALVGGLEIRLQGFRVG